MARFFWQDESIDPGETRSLSFLLLSSGGLPFCFAVLPTPAAFSRSASHVGTPPPLPPPIDGNRFPPCLASPADPGGASERAHAKLEEANLRNEYDCCKIHGTIRGMLNAGLFVRLFTRLVPVSFICTRIIVAEVLLPRSRATPSRTV